MSRLLSILLATGFGLGLNAAVAQNVDLQKDQAKGQEQQLEQKENSVTGAGQTQEHPYQAGENKFTEGKPQQSDADHGKTGRSEVDEKHFDQGKPGQSEAAQNQGERGQYTKQQ